jgi:hypothetical protein
MRLFVHSFLVAVVAMLAGQTMASQVTGTLTAQWTYPTEQEPTISGFRITNQLGAVVVDKVAPSARSATVQYAYDDSKPQAFHIVSYDSDGRQSNPSNIIVTLPKYRPMVGVGTVSIELVPK